MRHAVKFITLATASVVSWNARAAKDGHILAVGDQATLLRNHAASTTQLVDLQGRTVMPGFLEPTPSSAS